MIVFFQKLLEQQNTELRTRVAALQQELDTSETVQKDFVQLSQSLQVRVMKKLINCLKTFLGLHGILLFIFIIQVQLN